MHKKGTVPCVCVCGVGGVGGVGGGLGLLTFDTGVVSDCKVGGQAKKIGCERA